MDTRELIERLRYRVNNPSAWDSFEQAGSDLCADASAALSSQAAEIERLREALQPFADYCNELNGFLDNHNQPLPDDDGPGWVYVKIGDFRRARAALTPKPNKEG